MALNENDSKLRILLFDIDGTLIHSGGAGRRAMEQAFRDLFGIENGFDGIRMAGKTDPAILLAAFRKHNIKPEQQTIEEFKRRYFELLQYFIQQDLPLKRIFPGAKELLDRLASVDFVHLGLLTGNWLEGARIKLSHFSLYHYFSFGAFGSDSRDRNELLPFAIKRCPALNSGQIEMNQVIVIGDTPSDVECGKIHGAKTIAVASGPYSEEELANNGADLVVTDFLDSETIIKWVLQDQ